MPLMTKIRESMTTVFAVFAGLFVVYIVLDWGMDISGTQQAMRQSDAQMVGFVNGEGIPFQEFSAAVQQNVDGLKQQDQVDPDPRQVEMIRDQVWTSYLEEKLFTAEIERLGIRVTDQEIVDAVRGPSPPEFLRTQFTDSTGTFNREMYETAINDPRNRPQLIQVEELIRRQKLREKLRSVVTAGVRVPEGDILKRYNDINTEYKIEYALFEPARIGVTNDSITDAAIRAYYDEHIAEYKTNATRVLKYVLFKLEPSAEDTATVVAELEDIVRRANAGGDFEQLASTSGADPASDAFFGHGELNMPPDVETKVFAATPGSIIGPYTHTNGAHVVKVLEKRKGADEFVHAQHILVQDNDSAKALADAKALLARAKAGEDFGALAAEHSTEPGADTRKGDLGWFKRGRMVKEFEEAVFKAKPGTIIGPVKTQFGQHVIKIHAKDNAEVKVRDIRIPIEMSARTQGDVRSRAEDFAFLAREEGFEKEAGTAKLEILETRAFEENQGIPGIGMNRGISRFAFSGEAGDVSDAISVSNGVAVFTISEVKDAGVKSVDEVKDALRRVLIRENLFAKAKAIADERFAAWKPADSMSVLANGMSGVLVEATAGFRLDASIPRIGRDPAVSGVLDRMNQGEVSKPFVGGRGVYIIRIASKTSFDSTTYSVQRASLMQELLETKKSNFFSTWSASLMDHAEIVDNRDLFYR